jgi:hypothetical protein
LKKPTAGSQTSNTKTKKPKKTKEETPSPALEETAISATCQIKHADFQDIRLNKETVGTNFKKSLQPQGLDTWFKDAEKDLWEKRIHNPSSGKVITLQPKIFRLYSYAQSMNIHGVMGIAVDFMTDGKVIESRKYRSLGSTTNGWNAEREYYQALSYAAHDVMPKVLKDIPDICKKLN